MTAISDISHESSWPTCPLSCVAWEYVAEAFGVVGESAELVDLLSQARFQDRAAEVVRQHFNLSPPSSIDLADARDLVVLSTHPERFQALVHHAGAIVQAPNIAGFIDSASVRSICEVIGHNAWRTALAYPMRQSESQAPKSQLRSDLSERLDAIVRDGYRAAGTWFHTQPPALRAWLLLGVFHGIAPDALVVADRGQSALFIEAFRDAAIALSELDSNEERI